MAIELPHRALADRRAPAHRRLVHHVVVVERGQVGQLDDHRGLRHLGRGRVTELGGQRHEQRPEPLAAGVHQVPGDLAQQRVGGDTAVAQLRLDRLQHAPHRLLERRVVEGDADRRAGAVSGPLADEALLLTTLSTMPHPANRQRRRRGPRRSTIPRAGADTSQRTNSAALLARSSTGAGTTPSTSVASTPTISAAEVNAPGMATVGRRARPARTATSSRPPAGTGRRGSCWSPRRR